MSYHQPNIVVHTGAAICRQQQQSRLESKPDSKHTSQRFDSPHRKHRSDPGRCQSWPHHRIRGMKSHLRRTLHTRQKFFRRRERRHSPCTMSHRRHTPHSRRNRCTHRHRRNRKGHKQGSYGRRRTAHHRRHIRSRAPESRRQRLRLASGSSWCFQSVLQERQACEVQPERF